MKIEIKNNKDFSFTGYEENFLEVLQTHKLFERFVGEIREVLGISQAIKARRDTPRLDERKKEMLKNLAVLLVGIYKDLPEEWHKIFIDIIMTGTASPITSNAISFSLDDNFYEPEGKELKITIRKSMEFQQVIEFLTLHKLELDKFLEKLPAEHTTKISYIKSIQELIRLKKENPKMSHQEIVKVYQDNHPLSLQTTLIDYSSFNVYYGRYKKIQKKLLKTNPQGIKILKSTLFNLRGRI